MFERREDGWNLKATQWTEQRRATAERTRREEQPKDSSKTMHGWQPCAWLPFLLGCETMPYGTGVKVHGKYFETCYHASGSAEKIRKMLDAGAAARAAGRACLMLRYGRPDLLGWWLQLSGSFHCLSIGQPVNRTCQECCNPPPGNPLCWDAEFTYARCCR